ncbi:MAG: hypothetical protein HW404_1842 [Anaerolineales bacterium]|jgi:hypothetical protein|nr:hypothetical protein [Anaerolineales bacterium]
MIGGNSFFMDIGKVAEAAGKFGQQKSLTEQSQGIVKAFGPKITSAWTGKDAQEFALDIGRKLVPKYVEFALAFTGVQATLTKSTETAGTSDKTSSGLAQGFADQASQICNF